MLRLICRPGYEMLKNIQWAYLYKLNASASFICIGIVQDGQLYYMYVC